MTTWEAAVHYDSIYSLAKAIQAANTVDDIYAIRAAFPKAFPLLADKFNNEDYGISPAGRVYAMSGVQYIKNGKFMPTVEYVWWAKTQAEFDKVKKTTKLNVSLRWFKSKMGTIE